jgi:hypothetical protein
MVTSFPVVFDERRSARAITIDSIEDIPTALLEFGFRSRRPVVVVIGGASLMGDQGERLQDLFNRFLAPFIEESGGYAIDGGTAAGVMRLMGMAREKIGGTFPLIGVCPSALARWPDRSNSHPNAADLEPNHSHFILVPGSSGGDESPVLAEISKLLRQKNASVALLVNGGAIALQDARENLRVGNPLLVIVGTGRLADEIAVHIRNPGQPVRSEIVDLFQAGKITLFDLDSSLEEFRQTVIHLFDS